MSLCRYKHELERLKDNVNLYSYIKKQTGKKKKRLEQVASRWNLQSFHVGKPARLATAKRSAECERNNDMEPFARDFLGVIYFYSSHFLKTS